jgi:hypothetical protein
MIFQPNVWQPIFENKTLNVLLDKEDIRKVANHKDDYFLKCKKSSCRATVYFLHLFWMYLIMSWTYSFDCQ